MKVEIDHKLLSDSPLNNVNEALFSTVVNKSTGDLIEDIMNGHPTCYLVSGYRGSGKSSFVKKIQFEIKKIKGNKENENQKVKETVFVHSNFSKYNDQTLLIRKLIRGLYLEINGLESFKLIKAQEQKNQSLKRTALLLEALYEKTFYDTYSQSNESLKKDKTTIFNLDLIALIKVLWPSLLMFFFILNWIFSWFDLNKYFHLIAIVISSAFAIPAWLKLNHQRTKTQTNQKDFTRKSLYDNEIADYHLLNILTSIKDKYRIIFVLDELDKIDSEKIDAILNEMKPYLVSGTASYIVVAGQSLFYRYFESKTIDDALLSSMFSKFIHVPLFSRIELQRLFTTLLKNNQSTSDKEEKTLNNYADFLIFESKRVPRKFISLIRQNLVWENSNSFLFINDEDNSYWMYSRINRIIDRIENTEISTQSFDDAVKDYCKMQLYLKSHVRCDGLAGQWSVLVSKDN